MQEIQWYKYIMPSQEYLANVHNVMYDFTIAVNLFSKDDISGVLMLFQHDPDMNMIYYVSYKGFKLMEKLLGENNYSFSPCEQPSAKKIKYYGLLSPVGWDINLLNKILRVSGILDE